MLNYELEHIACHWWIGVRDCRRQQMPQLLLTKFALEPMEERTIASVLGTSDCRGCSALGDQLL